MYVHTFALIYMISLFMCDSDFKHGSVVLPVSDLHDGPGEAQDGAGDWSSEAAEAEV